MTDAFTHSCDGALILGDQSNFGFWMSQLWEYGQKLSDYGTDPIPGAYDYSATNVLVCFPVWLIAEQVILIPTCDRQVANLQEQFAEKNHRWFAYPLPTLFRQVPEVEVIFGLGAAHSRRPIKRPSFLENPQETQH